MKPDARAPRRRVAMRLAKGEWAAAQEDHDLDDGTRAQRTAASAEERLGGGGGGGVARRGHDVPPYSHRGLRDARSDAETARRWRRRWQAPGEPARSHRTSACASPSRRGLAPSVTGGSAVERSASPPRRRGDSAAPETPQRGGAARRRHARAGEDAQAREKRPRRATPRLPRHRGGRTMRRPRDAEAIDDKRDELARSGRRRPRRGSHLRGSALDERHLVVVDFCAEAMTAASTLPSPRSARDAQAFGRRRDAVAHVDHPNHAREAADIDVDATFLVRATAVVIDHAVASSHQRSVPTTYEALAEATPSGSGASASRTCTPGPAKVTERTRTRSTTGLLPQRATRP